MSKVHPTAIVHEGARLGADVEIGAYSIVGPKAVLGDGVRLLSHVVIEGDTKIGEGTVVSPFACLGGPPQHLGHKGEDTRLVVGARNVVREHVTMHAGTVMGGGVTVVGDDGLFMAGSHVAHDCIIGNRVVLANGVQVGGHAKIGDFVFLGGLAAVHQHTRLGRYSFVGGVSAVTKDIIPYGSAWGNPARLEGLNLVGLKRRGFSREAVGEMRAAFRGLFAPEGTFQERIDDVAATHAHSPEVMEIVGFIRADANRPLCLPSE
jgi:UDP-N-acetylglucosamine acyltransferase